jgi:hypothetical protein
MKEDEMDRARNTHGADEKYKKNSLERDNSEDTGVDGRLIIKRILRK